MSHIRSIALRAFPYSLDGFTVKTVGPHEEFDCPPHLFEALNSERYIRRAEIGDGHFELNTAPADAEGSDDDETGTDGDGDNAHGQEGDAGIIGVGEIEIPEEWRSLKFFALRSLANKVSSADITDQASAVAAIEAEIERRAAAGAAEAEAEAKE